MDPLTQGALGAVVGYAAGHRQLGARAAVAGALAGMAPDLDLLYGALEGPFARLQSHRGLTHSLFFGPVAGSICGWLWWRRRRQRGADDGPAAYMLVVAAAMLSHPLLDVFTHYGTQLMQPFSNARFALPAIPVVDPLYTLILVAGLWLALRGAGRGSPGRWAAAALVLSTGYLFLGLAINDAARDEARRQLAALDVTPLRVDAWPTMLQLPHRRLVGWTADHVYVGFISMWRPCPVRWVAAPRYDSPRVRALRGTPEGEIFAWFSGGNLVARERVDGGERIVEVSDMRYGMTPDPRLGMWGIRARYAADGVTRLSQIERFQNRPEVAWQGVVDLFAEAFPAACERRAPALVALTAR